MSKIKHLMNWLIFLIVPTGICFLLFFFNDRKTVEVTKETEGTSVELLAEQKEEKEAGATIIDVPLENQNEGNPPLENGCEITALSMLLNYYGYETNKNKLAEQLNYVPLYEDESQDIHGNPHDGFVGNIYGGYDAMGVAVEPIAAVAEDYVEGNHSVVSSSSTDFSELAAIVQAGTPVWVVTTVDFQVPTANDFQTWQTTSGEVTVSPLCHAVVVTGVDSQHVYVNDPYGYKNRIVDRSEFEEIFQAMGNESLYIETND
ncbi:C39 family peptidase [Enterococcus hermanniensis]|uniref:C39 family peptidase n=1 Tax=Enterococcus hermanniensis TaxID=249189 RepID=UPI001FE55DD1|nr:C39 family peptidase [Enterococcus hermanniensis]